MDRVVSLSAYRESSFQTNVAKDVLGTGFSLVEAPVAQSFFGISAYDFAAFSSFWADALTDGSTLAGRGSGVVHARAPNGVESVKMTVRSGLAKSIASGNQPIIRPVPVEFYQHKAMQAFVQHFCGLFDHIEGHASPAHWQVDAYPSRIHLNNRVPTYPTTHGLRVHGIHFGCSILVRRDNLVGGATLLCDLARNVIADATLTAPLDLIVIDMRTTMFATYTVERDDAAQNGCWDTLFLSFRKLPETAAS